MSVNRCANLAAPRRTTNLVTWLKQRLFSSKLNTVTTLLLLYLLYIILKPIILWGIINADWIGSSRNDCTSGGACWVFIYVRFDQFMYGFYPSSEYWRINLGAISLIFLMLPLFIRATPPRIKKILGLFLVFIYPIIAYQLLLGGYFGLSPIESSQVGGLTLTLILAVVGVVAAIPLGILLALGRRSKMPALRSLSIAYIELWRGVPLITVLFMASVMLPLFLPEGVTFDKLMRALIGIVLFQAAYMAEVVRSGLQAIPKGQYEAAEALGLSYWKTMWFIILPQALKLVIPGIVNTSIELFKDTTLVLIIGLFDVLAIIQTAYSDPHWLGYAIEGYVFAALIFWFFCYSLSRYSQSLERKLHRGH